MPCVNILLTVYLSMLQLLLLLSMVRVPTNLELSGNFVNLEKSGNLRYGQGIFCDMSHGY